MTSRPLRESDQIGVLIAGDTLASVPYCEDAISVRRVSIRKPRGRATYMGGPEFPIMVYSGRYPWTSPD